MFLSLCRSSVRRTFWEPFRDIRRAAVLAGCFFGSMGFTLLMTSSSYDLSSAGMGALFAYFIPALIFPGLVYWPLLYLGFSTLDSKIWRWSVWGAQLAALALYLTLPVDALSRGLASGIVIAPYYCAFHICMVGTTTSDNRPYETALSGVLSLLGSGVGYVFVGLFLGLATSGAATLLALAALILGTGSLLAVAPWRGKETARSFFQAFLRLFKINRSVAPRIITQGLLDMPGALMAALMKLLGYAPHTMALILLLRLGISFFMAPAIGFLVDRYRAQSLAIAVLGIGAVWLLLWAFPHSLPVFVFFLVVNGLGVGLADTALSASLYEMKSFPALMTMEGGLSLGRVAHLAFFAPLMFSSVSGYMAALVGQAFVLLLLITLGKKRFSFTRT